MAFQITNVPFKLTSEDMGIPDIFSSIQRGINFKQNMMKMPEELKQLQLANALKSIEQKKAEAELPYAGNIAKATADYKIAMAKYLSSPNQSLKYLSNVGKTYIEPNIVDAILKSRGIQNSNPNQGFEYNNFNQNNAKQQNNDMQANNEMQNGNMPYNNMPYNNILSNNQENNENINDAYALQRQKITTDAQARNRNLFATNIEKTISYINPKDLTQYGGFKGQLEKMKQTGLSSLGKESENFDNYSRSVNAVKLLTKQIRQFYGDSIQPSMQENLEKLNNPATWSVNPKLAESIFNQTVNILRNELGTYRQAVRTPKAYEEQSLGLGNSNVISEELRNSKLAKNEGMAEYSLGKNKNGNPIGVIEDRKKIGDRIFEKINGEWYEK